jgi:hypothetical protein
MLAWCRCAAQALQLVTDVHMLADQVRVRCGAQTPDRSASGALTPRLSVPSLPEDQVFPVPFPPFRMSFTSRSLFLCS